MLTEIELPDRKADYRGKVRDVYDLGDRLMLVATDRLSAFDIVFREGIPGKGCILTSISTDWFRIFNDTANHMISADCNDWPEPFRSDERFHGRSVLVKKTDRIDFECVVRNYLMGSAYKEYLKTGRVAGVAVGSLKPGDRLSEPLFTPATKADTGHDINITYEEMRQQTDYAADLKEASIRIFNRAAGLLEKHGILLLDTKFEFGTLNSELILIDEILTPDSSRFCTVEDYEQSRKEGVMPPTMDKQIIRDFLEESGWNKQPPPPPLPEKVINRTREEYLKIQRITKCISEEK